MATMLNARAASGVGPAGAAKTGAAAAGSQATTHMLTTRVNTLRLVEGSSQTKKRNDLQPLHATLFFLDKVNSAKQPIKTWNCNLKNEN
jgi:hypothetical protein